LAAAPSPTDNRRVPPSGGLWLHAVSLGEVQALRPLVEQLQRQAPQLPLVISSTTETGMAAARELFGEQHWVFRKPLDFSGRTAQLLDRLRPRGLVLMELELWPNLIRLSHRRQIPIMVANGRLSSGSFRGYRRFRWLLNGCFGRLSRVLAQSEDYAERFVAMGTPAAAVQVTGNVKFDGVCHDRHHPHVRTLAAACGVTDRDRIWLAGSTQDPEEQRVLETFQQMAGAWPDLRLIIVPRHPHRAAAVRLLASQQGWRTALSSDSTSGGSSGSSADRWQVLVVDQAGQLRWWWGLAEFGFVGGSFGSRGGQNMIEPAAYGVSICVGPNTRNFRAAVETLRSADAIGVLERPSELADWLSVRLQDPPRAAAEGARAAAAVARHAGAAARTAAAIVQVLSQDSAMPPREPARQPAPESMLECSAASSPDVSWTADHRRVA
jgi:3-deoxy-D-manno-octulosonic-acid transferase